MLQAASPKIALTKHDTSAVSSRELYAGSGAELNKGDRRTCCEPGESTIPRESILYIEEAETRLPHNAVSMTALVSAGIVKCGQPPNVRNCSADEPAVQLTRVDCPSRPRPGSTPEYLYFTPVAANRFSDVHRERLLGRTGGVHLCKAGDPQVVDPARSIGDYRLKGELPTGYVSS